MLKILLSTLLVLPMLANASFFGPSGGTVKAAIVADYKAEGTNGGTANADAYVSKRNLNTVTDPDGIGIATSSNSVVFPAGNYFITVDAPFFQTTACNIQLYNEETDEAIVYGTTAYSGAAELTHINSHVAARVTLVASAALSVYYHCDGSQATNGLGVASSGITQAGHKEIYTVMKILKF